MKDKLKNSVPSKGIRNITLFKHLCALKGKGANKPIALSYAKYFCDRTGLREIEGIKTLESAWLKAANRISLSVKDIICESDIKPILDLDILKIIDGLSGDTVYVEALAKHFINKYRFCTSNRTWYVCEKNVWKEMGSLGQPNVAGPLEKYFKTYMDLGEEVSDAIGNIHVRRQSFNSINAMWQLLRQHDSLVIHETDFDKNSMMIPFKNAVVKLKDGSNTVTVEPLHWSNYIRKTLSMDWKSDFGTYGLVDLDMLCKDDEDFYRFDKMLSDIFHTNPELKPLLAKLLGYAISGTAKKIKKLPILIGSGNNGKSVLFRCLQSSLYPLCLTIDKSIVVRREVFDSAPKPELLALKGARIGFVGETEETDYLNESTVKALTGGDIRTARNLYSKEMVQLEPTYTLFLATNHEPRIATGDAALWDRILPIPFNTVFTNMPTQSHEKPIDKTIWDWIATPHWGVIIYLLRSWLIYSMEGFGTPPEIVTQFVEEYKEEEDPFADFRDDCLLFEKDQYIQTKSMILAYRNWCNDNQIHLNPRILNRTIKRGIEKALAPFGVELKRKQSDKSRLIAFHGVCFKPLIFDKYAKPRPIKKQN